MKKIVANIVCAVSIAFIAWVAISVIEVGFTTPVDGFAYSPWNFFLLF